jgi:hypothetical protein
MALGATVQGCGGAIYRARPRLYCPPTGRAQAAWRPPTDLPEVTMQTKFHTTFATAAAGAVLALAVASPAAFSNTTSEPPGFPSAVPAQPGQVTGPAAAVEKARAKERYLTSYGNPKPLTAHEAPADDGGVDWAAIGIALGASCILVGALVALVSRTRRRTHRVRVAA